VFVCEHRVAPGEACAYGLVQENDVVSIGPSRFRW
jgi:hypothetical protein